MKTIAAITALLIATVGILIFLNEQPSPQSLSEQPAAPFQADDSGSAAPADTSPGTLGLQTVPQQPSTDLDTLLATLYASSNVDALLAGALISQHLIRPQQEDLYSSYRPQEFYTLALSLNPRDPILLFAVSNYCLSIAANDKFCQQNHYLQAFSEVSGNNSITWAMRAARSYRSGNFHEIPDLLQSAEQAILFTDYWPEIILILLQAFQEADYAASLQQAYFSAFEVMPSSFHFYRDLLAMCTGSSELDKSQWLSACRGLGRIMQQSSSLMTTSIGLTIENSAAQSMGLAPSSLAEQAAEISHLSMQLNKVIQRAQEEPASLQLYLDDLKKFGEKESLRRAESRLDGGDTNPP